MPSPTRPAGHRPEARHQLIVGVAALIGLYAVVFGPGVLASWHPGLPGLDWQARVAAIENDVFIVFVVVTVVLRWLPRHVPDLALGLDRRIGRPVPGGMIGAASVYVAIALGSGWAGTRLVAALHVSGGAYPDTGRGVGDLLTTCGAAIAAGLSEELVLVALVVAVLDHGWTRLGRRPWWAGPVTIALLLGLRWSVHLYYGWDGLFVAFWAPAVYALYRWVGTVWPLVFGHIGYDVVLAVQHAYPALSTSLDRLLWLVAAVGAGVLVMAGRGTRHAGMRNVSFRFRN